jgi:hypothetical protein
VIISTVLRSDTVLPVLSSESSAALEDRLDAYHCWHVFQRTRVRIMVSGNITFSDVHNLSNRIMECVRLPVGLSVCLSASDHSVTIKAMTVCSWNFILNPFAKICFLFQVSVKIRGKKKRRRRRRRRKTVPSEKYLREYLLLYGT